MSAWFLDSELSICYNHEIYQGSQIMANKLTVICKLALFCYRIKLVYRSLLIYLPQSGYTRSNFMHIKTQLSLELNRHLQWNIQSQLDKNRIVINCYPSYWAVQYLAMFQNNSSHKNSTTPTATILNENCHCELNPRPHGCAYVTCK